MGRRTGLYAVMTAVALGGCAAYLNDPKMVPAHEILLSAEQFAAVQDAVKRELRDPISPLFGIPAAGIDDKGLTIVCGLVNAKNGFGGYVGAQPYMGSLVAGPRPGFVVMAMSSSPAMKSALLTECYSRNLVPKDVPISATPAIAARGK